jgi:DNA-binding NtrC family response regulator
MGAQKINGDSACRIVRLLAGKDILIADDEARSRDLYADYFAEIGITVVEAEDGVAALGKFQAEPDRFGLVILDLIMPHMLGSEVFKAIHAHRPSLPVILVSGYTLDISISDLTKAGLSGYLSKPCSYHDLMGLVATVLAVPVMRQSPHC